MPYYFLMQRLSQLFSFNIFCISHILFVHLNTITLYIAILFLTYNFITIFECFMGFLHAPAVAYINITIQPPPLRICKPKKKTTFCVMKLNNNTNNNDPLFLSASTSAFLRFHQTNQPEPLFVDPYAACLVPPYPNIPEDTMHNLHPYCLATKFIDDKLLGAASHIDGVKQVVLFTDGMDTRPYRLRWPTSTIIFDISSERIFKTAAENLKGVGAKIPKSCLLYHIPLESSDTKQGLQFRGYNGSRPSVWALQGFPMMTLAKFEDVLSMISSLAMKGSFFVGELPSWLSEAEIKIKSNTRQWMEKLFMSNGFRVEMIDLEGVVECSQDEFAPGDYNNILFVAEQLRFSDDQVRYLALRSAWQSGAEIGQVAQQRPTA
ncbi:putative methyltransferase Ppm1/Ppm2/Tcmp, S-adenosyl-L-methionine-dependent methyltransferase [Lupinus albus]|uniref:Putative methyltransferase Ppm1/Ppm2/Tcmp, S-adenosyl-L-methionine-dependent methyltransferase n=1 Tax=Lupinus albus TaxID=3870 RepID=A0A6A4QXC5_LUPAL|nr:putative methyltransferase Ppm1/Ppm2/Tcmp, S-adenosyl-L-methionine-dependent methyltransferase [Lupinus albus]